VALFLGDEDVLDVSKELKRLAGPDDAVVSSRPTLYRGLTGLRSYRFPLTRDRERVLAALEKGQWVIIDLRCREDRAFALPVIEAHPEHFGVEAQGTRVALYRRTSNDRNGQ
jgi:hypothetical protein